MKKRNSITVAVLDILHENRFSYDLVHRHITLLLLEKLMIISPDNTFIKAVPMSKQVNRVNIEPEIFMETGLPTGSITKHNFFVNPFTFCKTDIIICNNTL